MGSALEGPVAPVPPPPGYGLGGPALLALLLLVFSRAPRSRTRLALLLRLLLATCDAVSGCVSSSLIGVGDRWPRCPLNAPMGGERTVFIVIDQQKYFLLGEGVELGTHSQLGGLSRLGGVLH